MALTLNHPPLNIYAIAMGGSPTVRNVSKKTPPLHPMCVVSPWLANHLANKINMWGFPGPSLSGTSKIQIDVVETEIS